MARRWLLRSAGLMIGSGARIVGGARFHYHTVSLGDACWVGTETHFFSSESARIEIGARVDIAPGCMFNTGSHQKGSHQRRAGRNCASTIRIGDGTWIGMGVQVLDGTTVGAGCIIAAGAVVRGNFPDDVLIAGVPARVVRELHDAEPTTPEE